MSGGELSGGSLPLVGWREWVVLPSLGVRAVKAKIDTGACSSALHAFDICEYVDRGQPRVRFSVHPYQRKTAPTIIVESDLVEYRNVRSSGGHVTRRPVIVATIRLVGQEWPIELTLVSRDAMGFRMLLGRQAIAERFAVDPSRSYLGGRRKDLLRKKKPG
jgi:hypothetical protein